MLLSDFTKKFLGLQGVEVKNFEIDEENLYIIAGMKRKPHNCICCGTATDTIHDYRTQVIKDCPLFGKNFYIKLRKRRYRCSACGKRFYEDVPFLSKYHRFTKRLFENVIDTLRSVRSFTSVAEEYNMSVSTVIRIFDCVSYGSIKELPKTVAIDEFKGNTSGEKYQCIITDPENHRVLDILPKRSTSYLSPYFKHIGNRSDVQLFISDMWRPYADIAKTYCKNADLVIDKYHWIRQCTWAFEGVRKEVQKNLPKEQRIYFKHSRKLLLKRFDTLTDDQKRQVNVMLYYSATLSSAHFLKEDFQKILDCEDRNAAKAHLIDWIENAQSSNIIQFKKCANAMYNWFSGILNSFNTQYTNGFTEGCNNKIKVLKRNAYGYKNFNRFRNRILHMFSYQKMATA